MSWIDIVWPMVGAASLTLGMIHLFIWLHRRSEWTHLAFSMAALCVAVLSIMELMSIRSVTGNQYATIIRWGHVPYAIMIVSLVVYVHLRFPASRIGLAALACIARLSSLVPNFMTGVNLNFGVVQSVERVEVLGDYVMAPIGVGNPWMIWGQCSQLLMIIYLANVIIRTWRMGSQEQRRRALVVCGSIILFMLSNNIWSVLVVLGVVHSPIVVNITFVFVMLVMSYELGGDVLRAAILSESLAGSQKRLRESEQRLQLAATAGGLGLWAWKVSVGGSWLTDNGNALLGLVPGEKIAWQDLLSRVHPDDLPGLYKAREAALGGAPYAYEFRCMQSDGSLRWLAVSGSREPGDDDNAGILHGVLQDVTERRLAEERFRLVVENAPYAILMIDKDRRIALANAHAERLLGYDRTELGALELGLLLSPESRAGQSDLRAIFSAAPSGPNMMEGRTLVVRRKDGTELPVEIVLTPLHMEGSPYTIASITDVSEKLKFEQQAATQRDELAHLSRISLLGEISGSLAHELNQPLTAVLSNAQAALRFIKHDPPNLEEVQESLLHIVESDKRASEVIRRLRAMMRKDAVKHEHMDLNETVRESLQLLRTDLINHHVATLLDYSPDCPIVIGDAVQIKQVLLNLIINACDAMKSSEQQRLLTVRTFCHAQGTVEITVADSGGGIPAEDLERIFTPFVTTKSEGIGLGLAICRTIIQAHGGRLWAINNDFGGATFHVLLTTEAARSV